MDPKTKLTNIKEMVKLFKIFSDMTRLRIIDLLEEKELSVQEIADTLETSQSAISHQLKLLRDLHVVQTRKEGKKVFYSLQDNHIKELFLIGYAHATECRKDEY